MNSETTAVEDVAVNHGRGDVSMTQELLHGADVVASFQQVCCERVAQAMAGAEDLPNMI